MERVEIVQLLSDDERDIEGYEEMTFHFAGERGEDEYYNEDDDEYYDHPDLQLKRWIRREWHYKDFLDCCYIMDKPEYYTSIFINITRKADGRIKSQGIKKLPEKKKRVNRPPPVRARKKVRRRTG